MTWRSPASHVPDYTPPTWPGGETPKRMHLDPAGHPFCLTVNIPFQF